MVRNEGHSKNINAGRIENQHPPKERKGPGTIQEENDYTGLRNGLSIERPEAKGTSSEATFLAKDKHHQEEYLPRVSFEENQDIKVKKECPARKSGGTNGCLK